MAMPAKDSLRLVDAAFRDTTAKLPRALRRAILAVAVLAVMVAAASAIMEGPLRRSIERRMNESLTGYHVRLPKLRAHLLGLAITLENLTVRQTAHPEPPVLVVPKLHASVEWKELLTFHLVADFEFDEPRVHLDLTQLRKESEDKIPVKNRGWQRAFEAIYPLKINLLEIRDADFTYVDEDPRRPLTITHFNLTANNIRNIHSPEDAYPSPVEAEGVILKSGRGRFAGHADFLREPYAAVHAVFRLSRVPLDYFRPMLERSSIRIHGGSLSTRGEMEYAPTGKTARLDGLTIRGVRVDLLHSPETASAERARDAAIARNVRKASNAPGLQIETRTLSVVDSEVGLVNRARTPPYRVFLSHADLKVSNLSNQFRQGPANARLTGLFMGEGRSVAEGTFRPARAGPDFDLSVRIGDTPLTAMNDLLRAYGKFDVVGGTFSMYTQLKVHGGRVDGYLKPFFSDVDVYDRRQDRSKSLFHKAYEAIVGALSNLLENPGSDKLATKATISGPVGGSSMNTLQTIVRLIQNAFFKAILPGFERAVTGKK